MKRTRWMLAAVLAFVTAMPVLAQTDDPKQPPEREGRREDGRRGRFDGRRGRARSAEARLDQLSEQLNLDPQQRREIGALLQAHDDKMRELRQANRPSEEDQNEMRTIRDELRQAQENGDKEEIAEIRGRIREFRDKRQERMKPVQEAIAAAEKTLHDDILGKLNENQTESFESVWSDVMAPRRGRAGRFDPRQLHNTVMQLDDLTEDQKKAVDKLFDDFRVSQRDKRGDRRDARPDGRRDGEKGDPKADRPRRGPRDRGARGPDPAVKKLYEDLMAQLTETQRAEVEKKLSRRGPRNRGDRPGRDARGDRGRFRRPGEGRPGADRPGPDDGAEDDG